MKTSSHAGRLKQPAIEVMWDEPKGQGIMLDIEDVDVVLMDVGTVQLWYGDEIGVVWEAFYDTGVQHRPEHERLLHQLWSACEAYLQKKGARYAFTYARDPNYEDAWYGAFLHARGYRRDPARAHLPGEQMVVVKGLGV